MRLIAAWYSRCVLGGFAGGFITAVFALVISGIYMPRLDWLRIVPLPLFPVLALAAFVRWGPDVAITHRLVGVILFAGVAFMDEFLLAALIAKADHG